MKSAVERESGWMCMLLLDYCWVLSFFRRRALRKK